VAEALWQWIVHMELGAKAGDRRAVGALADHRFDRIAWCDIQQEKRDDQDPEHHRLLLLNAFAQGAALMQGQPSDDPQRNYPGNRPSSTILMQRLDPRALGALIAFYEHRVFANAVLLGINPFDQFGVELGKLIARQLSEGADKEALDPSTRALMKRAGL